MINAQTIKKNFDLFMTRLTTSPGIEGDLQDEDDVSGEQHQTDNTSISDQIVVIIDNAEERLTEQPTRTEDTQSGTQTQTQSATQTQSQSTAQPQTQTQPPLAESTAQTRERSVYFTHIDKDGQILQSKVTRRIPVSETPMQDVLNIMFAGPSADEINRGILNLIPGNTRLLSATVRGSTAYISFSEDFLFNTFGVEGYVAQLRQVVWTVTEFPNVNDVQILVDGRRIDYLGEGIYIGSPISRQSF